MSNTDFVKPMYCLYRIPGMYEFIVKNDKSILKLNNMLELTEKEKYTVVRYNKNLLTCDLVPTYGVFRSVIFNSINTAVGFAPPKSLPCDYFMNHYQNTSELIIEEFVEGTMINVFWDPSSGLTGSWEIATRNNVGAESSFYKTASAKTFRSMFLEAAALNGLSFDILDKKYSYSFVLQHPENRIVVPFKKPQLYLVEVYQIDANKEEDITKCYTNIIPISIEWIKVSAIWLETSVKFPEKYDGFSSYTELIDKYASLNTPYHIVGTVIKNKDTGERCKIRNPVYEQVRQLRGNQPKLQFQYLTLRQNGKVRDYLQFYPEHKKEFAAFREQVHLFTNTVFQNYISCYIKKEKPLLEFPEQFRTHMFNIHQLYLTELKEKKLYVTNTTVINYVNKMKPSHIMFSINHPMRKRNTDFVAAISITPTGKKNETNSL